jgi:predicted GNAT family acetyltransferase
MGLLLAEGRDYCTLFVEVGNSAAQRIYERIGYRRVGGFGRHRSLLTTPPR